MEHYLDEQIEEMKKYIFILFLIVGHNAMSQKLIGKNKFNITIEAGKLTLQEAFSLLQSITPVTKFYYEFYVTKEDKKYMRSYLTFMPKNKVFLIEKGKRWKKVTI